MTYLPLRLFVVTVIVAIGGSVEDVEAINGSVIDR